MGSFEKTILRLTPWLVDKIPDRYIPDYGAVFRSKERKRADSHHTAGRDLRHSDAVRSHSDDEDYDDARRRNSRNETRRSRSARGPPLRYSDEDGCSHRSTKYQRQRRSRMPQEYEPETYETARAQPPYPEMQQRRQPSIERAPYGPATGVATGAATGAAAAREFQQPPASPDTALPRAPPAAGYVPYSDIYGQRDGEAQMHSTSARSDMNPVDAPHVGDRTYYQNASAQDVPYGRQPGYMPDAHSERDPRRFDDRFDDRYEVRRDDQHDGRYDDRFRGGSRHDSRTDYDSYDEYPEERVPRRRQYRGDYSPSSDSYYDDAGRRRSPAKGRIEDRARPKQRDKSGIREAFDTSEKSLGYSALGAVAGGLLGSELGGPLPIALGAAVGALGTNAFRARERKKEESQRNSAYLREPSRDRRRESRPRRSREESR